MVTIGRDYLAVLGCLVLFFFCFAFFYLGLHGVGEGKCAIFIYLAIFGRVMNWVWLSLGGHIKAPHGTSCVFSLWDMEGLWGTCRAVHQYGVCFGGGDGEKSGSYFVHRDAESISPEISFLFFYFFDNIF